MLNMLLAALWATVKSGLMQWRQPKLSSRSYFAFTVSSLPLFELHYDEGCLNNTKTRGNQCFSVQVLQNGRMLKFDTCMQDNNMQGRFGSPLCSFDSFIRHIDKLKYQGPLSIDEACVQPYNSSETMSSLFMHWICTLTDDFEIIIIKWFGRLF